MRASKEWLAQKERSKPKAPPPHGEQHTLGHELAHQAQPPDAYRKPHRDLFRTNIGAG
jgi:hypothetical protein